MMVDGKYYIVLVPGMRYPDEIPKGLEYINTDVKRWRVRNIGGCFTSMDTYRYPVTETEYKAHHWSIAHDVIIPEGYDVADFAYPGDKGTGAQWLSSDGRVCTEGENLYPTGQCPILRKKACEHKDAKNLMEFDDWIGVKCNDCGMVRKLGDWEESV